MTTPTQTNLPVLDLGPYMAGEPGAAEKAAAQLREINESIGFMSIINHGVSPELIDATFEQSARFHAQSMDAKLAVKVDLAMAGYLPMRSSTTRTSSLSTGNKPNENEAFFIKRLGTDAGADDRWPANLPGFRERALAYYDAMDALSQKLLPLYALALDLPADYFADKCDMPLTSLRLTHYPSVAYGSDQFGIAPHSDSSFFTLLAQNKVPGLQVKTQDGEWINAEVIPYAFVVNTGDVLHRWTNGKFLSTPHRAYNTAQTPRYAIPYFFHPNANTLIDVLPGCERPGEAPLFPALTTEEYQAWFRGRNYDHIRKEKGETPAEAVPAAAAE